MQVVTQTTSEFTLDIQLPFFRKKTKTSSIREYFGMIIDGFTLEAYINDERICVASNPKWLKNNEIAESYQQTGDWEECSEQEFMDAHAEALASLSLKPVLMEIPLSVVDDPNDLKEVNI